MNAKNHEKTHFLDFMSTEKKNRRSKIGRISNYIVESVFLYRVILQTKFILQGQFEQLTCNSNIAFNLQPATNLVLFLSII